jgi:hypothetical protein
MTAEALLPTSDETVHVSSTASKCPLNDSANWVFACVGVSRTPEGYGVGWVYCDVLSNSSYSTCHSWADFIHNCEGLMICQYTGRVECGKSKEGEGEVAKRAYDTQQLPHSALTRRDAIALWNHGSPPSPCAALAA